MIRGDKYFTTRPHGGIIQQSNNNSIVTRFPARSYTTLPLSKPDDADIHIQKIANHNKDNNDLITQSSSYNYNDDASFLVGHALLLSQLYILAAGSIEDVFVFG